MFRWARLSKASEQTDPPAAATAETAGAIRGHDLRDQIVAALRTVNDPEIPVNIYDLGLIYDLDIDARGHVEVRMTLTAPACPVAGMMPGMVEAAVRRVEGVTEVRVELVWDPPWTQERMTDEALLQLGLM